MCGLEEQTVRGAIKDGMSATMHFAFGEGRRAVGGDLADGLMRLVPASYAAMLVERARTLQVDPQRAIHVTRSSGDRSK
jgi:hypothetical protein